METLVTVLTLVGALCFGIVLGWICYRTLRRNQQNSINDLATVLGVLGGAVVTGLFKPESGAFGAYCIGLAIGFFYYLRLALRIAKETQKVDEVNIWLGSDVPGTNPAPPPVIRPPQG